MFSRVTGFGTAVAAAGSGAAPDVVVWQVGAPLDQTARGGAPVARKRAFGCVAAKPVLAPGRTTTVGRPGKVGTIRDTILEPKGEGRNPAGTLIFDPRPGGTETAGRLKLTPSKLTLVLEPRPGATNGVGLGNEGGAAVLCSETPPLTACGS